MGALRIILDSLTLPDYGCVTVRPVSPVAISSVTPVPAVVALPDEAAVQEGPEQVSLGQEGGGHQSSLTWHDNDT